MAGPRVKLDDGEILYRSPADRWVVVGGRDALEVMKVKGGWTLAPLSAAKLEEEIEQTRKAGPKLAPVVAALEQHAGTRQMKAYYHRWNE